MLALSLFAALFLAERYGEYRSKKWTDDFYAGSPLAEPADPDTSVPGAVATIALAHLPKDDTLHERAFHAKHERIIEKHKKLLIDAGRISDPEHFEATFFLGTYGWFHGICDEGSLEKPEPCYFGAYTFSQEAFEQAKKIYVLHGQMEQGSDLLVDVGAGAFDKEIVGLEVPYLTYCELTGGKLRHCDSGLKEAKVVEFIDKNTVRLNKKAEWNANMYGLTVKPDGYVDLCNCRVPMGEVGSN
jgi:hypothetical protein